MGSRLLATLAIEYIADLSDLESATSRVVELAEQVANQVSGATSLGDAFSHAAQEAENLGNADVSGMLNEINANAALAVLKIDDLADASEQAAQQAAKLKAAENEAAQAAKQMAAAKKQAADASKMLSHAVNETSGKIGELAGSAYGALEAFEEMSEILVFAGETLGIPMAEAQDAQVAFELLTGSAEEATRVLAGLDEAGQLLRFDDEKMQDAARALINVRMTGTEATATIQNVGNALLNAGKGEDELQTVVDTLAEMRETGVTTAAHLKVLEENGISATALLSSGFDLASEAVSEWADEGIHGVDTVGILLSEMEKLPDAASEFSNTIGGSFHILQEEAENALARIGEGMQGPVTQGMKDLAASMESPAFQNFAFNVGVGVGNALTFIGSAVTFVTPFFQNLSNSIGQVTLFFQQNEWAANTLQGALIVLGTIALAILAFHLWGVAAAAWGALVPLWTLLAPVIAVGIVIGVLVAAFIWLYQNSEPFQNAINSIGEIFMQIWNILLTNLIPVWEQLQIAFQKMQPVLQFIGAIILGALVIAIGILIGIVVALANGIAWAATGISGIIEGLTLFFTGAFEYLGGLIMFFVHLFTGQWDKLGGDLERMWKGIGMMFQGSWEFIKGIFATVLGFILGLVSGFVAGTVGFFGNLLSQGKQKTKDLVDGIVGFFINLPGQALEWGANIVNAFADGIRNAAGAVGNAVASVADTVKGWLGFGSPTEEGPGRFMPSWPQNLVEDYAAGVADGAPLLRASLAHFIRPIQALVEPISPSKASPTPSSSSSESNKQPVRQVFRLEVNGKTFAEATIDDIGPLVAKEVILQMQ